ncbi:MAG: GTPase domain-containing protein, partial [Oenococcus sp.]
MVNEIPPKAAHAITRLQKQVDMAVDEGQRALCALSSNGLATGPQEQATNYLMEKITALKPELETIVSQLMWTPCAAFYGETNAGKSTLIEALRLYFGEERPDAGISIGDGRSDFTQEATYYPCNVREHSFTLVDVPGIEGKESIVENAIKGALARSQIVFYITPDARPPQGGEKGQEGTLEKLARQLRPQAKIWAIWNKKVQTPRQFNKPLLEKNSDEWCSLHHGQNSLDTKMREILGDKYQTSLPVSARPAFLALATHLSPDSKLSRDRKRFLDRIPASEILTYCCIDSVAHIVLQGLPNKIDILKANFGKIILLLKELSAEIKEKLNKDFIKVALDLKKIIRKVEPDLERVSQDVKSNLRRLIDE